MRAAADVVCHSPMLRYFCSAIGSRLPRLAYYQRVAADSLALEGAARVSLNSSLQHAFFNQVHHHQTPSCYSNFKSLVYQALLTESRVNLAALFVLLHVLEDSALLILEKEILY